VAAMSDAKMQSQAVVVHAVCMTLLLFIIFPMLLLYFLKLTPENEFRFKLCQLTCSMIVIAIGSYASYVFSDHLSVHAISGLVIMCLLMPIWTLFQTVHSLKPLGLDHERAQFVRKWMSLVMLLFVFPTQWMLGIQYITYETGTYSLGHTVGYFLGHYFPGYCFMISGVAIIWLNDKMDTVMKGEIFVLGPAALFAMIGELVSDLSPSNPHFWHHIVLECAAMMLSFLCFVIYKFQIAKRSLLHGLCMSMFWGIFGYMMLSHQTSGDLREMMHKVVGGMTIATAFIRIAVIFWDKLPVIYGFLALISGMLFNFSNPCLSEYWENVLQYPTMAYIAIVMLFGFYLSTLSGISQQITVKKESEPISEKKLRSEWDERTPLVDGRTNAPNHGVIDISGLSALTSE